MQDTHYFLAENRAVHGYDSPVEALEHYLQMVRAHVDATEQGAGVDREFRRDRQARFDDR